LANLNKNNIRTRHNYQIYGKKWLKHETIVIVKF